MSAKVAERMTELLIDVAQAAEDWTTEAASPGIKEESDAHEGLVHAILTYAEEYRGLDQIQPELEVTSMEEIEKLKRRRSLVVLDGGGEGAAGRWRTGKDAEVVHLCPSTPRLLRGSTP